MVRLRGSPPGRWRGSGDDRRVWIENFGRHWHRAKGKGQSGRPTRIFGVRTRKDGWRIPGYEGGPVRCGPEVPTQAWSQHGLPDRPPGPSLFTPLRALSTGSTKTTHCLIFPTYSNLLPAISYATRALRCHPRCPFCFFLFDGDLVF